MNKAELIAEIERIKNAAADNPDREVACAAGVLAALAGGMYAGTTEGLFAHVVEFSKAEIARILSRRN